MPDKPYPARHSPAARDASYRSLRAGQRQQPNTPKSSLNLGDLVFATDRCNVLEDPWRDHAIPVRYYDETSSAAVIRSGSFSLIIISLLFLEASAALWASDTAGGMVGTLGVAGGVQAAGGASLGYVLHDFICSDVDLAAYRVYGHEEVSV